MSQTIWKQTNCQFYVTKASQKGCSQRFSLYNLSLHKNIIKPLSCGEKSPEEVAGLADTAPGGVQHPEEQAHLAGQAELLLGVWGDGQHGLPDGWDEEQHLHDSQHASV